MINYLKKSAEISECGLYRYALTRVWDESKPLVLFIMLNPSTASGSIDDPTIRRCVGFASNWGYGGILVGNLFAFRATNPIDIPKVIDPNHADLNSQSVMEMYWKSKITVFAWGNPPIAHPSCPLVGFQNTFNLGLTKRLNPKHPLYIKKDQPLIKYEQKNYFG